MISMHHQQVNVERGVLIKKLEENLKVHKAEYDAALADYRLVLQKKLQAALKASKDDEAKITDVTAELSKLTPPQDHRADYAGVIEMLTYSVDEKIELDRESFKAYVKNDWPWMNAFKASNAFYAEAAGAVGSKRR